MLRSIKQLYGNKLGALDGDIGHVKDFYFNDQDWVVRYVIADTASWLPGRLVLISPHAFGNFQTEDDSISVQLTRQQIENSPTIESHKPVSRQHEEEYYQYYGWPSYWDGNGIWGVSGFPVAPPPMGDLVDQEKTAISLGKDDDLHLRSMQKVIGYHIHTSEGSSGHVTDFIMDDKNWKVHQLVVKIGTWFGGKEILISPTHIDCISYDESTVFINEPISDLQPQK